MNAAVNAMTMLDRRSFLRAAGATPLWWSLRGAGAWAPRGDDRTLLVLELAGGNDGLNTVIPADQARYAALRPKLQAVRSGAHRLADGTMLHGALGRLHALVGDGAATVVHGVGYAKPDRSHFRSRDIWHVADPAHERVGTATTGWLGRAADLLAAASAGVPAAAIGGLQVPLLLKSRRATVPSLRRIEDFQWLSPTARGPLAANAPARAVLGENGVGGGIAGGDGSGRTAGGDELRAFVAATAAQGTALADSLAAALARYAPRAEYPGTQLGRDLQLCAQLVIAGFGTRLLHVAFGGFDTHARQLPAHAGLLALLDGALAAFAQDLRAHGAEQRVAVLVHSEFGRRAAENASQGTDHGAAAPAFVLFGPGPGGTVGDVPDLAKLDDGDPIAAIDFRRVYRDLLQWLGVDPTAVLGAPFATAGLAARGPR